jgi:hypothetical protein
VTSTGFEPASYSVSSLTASRWLAKQADLVETRLSDVARKTLRFRATRERTIKCLTGIEPAVLAAGLEPASSFDPGSEPGGYAIRLRERETRKHTLGDGIRTRGLSGRIQTEVLHHVELHPKHAADGRPPANRTQRELLIRKLRATSPS